MCHCSCKKDAFECLENPLLEFLNNRLDIRMHHVKDMVCIGWQTDLYVCDFLAQGIAKGAHHLLAQGFFWR